MSNTNGNKRRLAGVVVSDKMDKTVTVQVTRLVKHGTYGKFVKRSKRYHAHDEGNECKVNDSVTIEECRPLSATKRWKVIERRAGTQPVPEFIAESDVAGSGVE